MNKVGQAFPFLKRDWIIFKIEAPPIFANSNRRFRSSSSQAEPTIHLTSDRGDNLILHVNSYALINGWTLVLVRPESVEAFFQQLEANQQALIIFREQLKP